MHRPSRLFFFIQLATLTDFSLLTTLRSMSRYFLRQQSWALLLFFLAGLPATPAWSWSTDSTVNTVVSQATDIQRLPQIVADGSGGAFITWVDFRAGNFDIYAQRIDADGNPLWAAEGLAISTAASSQYSPQIITDNSGGVIITWYDHRNGNSDIYAQRINGDGIVQWAVNGVAIAIISGNQISPQIIADDTGGAIITWQDARSIGNADVYAQRIDAAGNSLWTTNGVPISTAASTQGPPRITTDGSGGAIITWRDARTGSSFYVYAQRIQADGTVQWAANGVPISTAANLQSVAQIISDGTGGAIITWADYRNISTSSDIYAQRINGAGAAQWTANGVPISIAGEQQRSPEITTDGSGGAIITWQDYRSGSNEDIYSQRVDSTGVTRWATNGIVISSAVDNQENPQIISDSIGGAIITWQDYRNGTDYNIYAQRINSYGDVQWPADGSTVSTAVDNQHLPQLTLDSSQSAIIVWPDHRSGTDDDIYCQKIYPGGGLEKKENCTFFVLPVNEHKIITICI